jgi:superfamily II DNA or RNA helicase
MAERNREWLRSFLRLDARSSTLTVPTRDIERQEDTVLRALSLLDQQPGVVLADEVGMGKTFEALGVIAARHHADTARRMLVLTPGPDLNTKWTKEFRAFCDKQVPMYRGFADQYIEARTLQDFVRVRHQKPIVVAPITMFQGARALEHNRYLLSLFFEWKQEHGNTRNAAFRRYRDGELSRVDVRSERFLGEVEWSVIEPVMDGVFLGSDGRPVSKLEEGWRAEHLEFFAARGAVDAALAELRFRLVGALIPDLDLLVVDEAHKLKNAGSLRALAVREVFDRRFEKALFLTATPFQLDVSELRQVLDLFSLARSAPADLAARADALLADISEYKRAYDDFEAVWRRLDGQGAAEFAALHAEDPKLAQCVEEPTLSRVVERARHLLRLKQQKIEPGFRTWMIRSLREDKRTYRAHARKTLRPKDGAAVPFLLYERFIAGLFREKTRTHKAAVQINMVSSYAAARTGALLAEEKSELTGDAESYRQLLRKVLAGLRDERDDHPKLSYVVRDALDAADKAEKTLIFCARVESLGELSRQVQDAWLERLVQRWRAVHADASRETVFDSHETDESRHRGHHSRIQERFRRTQDPLFLALREKYLETVPGLGAYGREHVDRVLAVANELVSAQRVVKSRAERFDWSLAKRCVEHATARLALEGGETFGEEAEPVRRLANPLYLSFGYDLLADKLEPDEVGEHQPSWTIEREDAVLILDPAPNLWSYLKRHLLDVPEDLRVQTVERLAAYLGFREVPFMVDLLTEAKRAGLETERIESLPLLRFMDVFWRGPVGRSWIDRIAELLAHLNKLDEERRRELVDDALTAGQFARHTASGESRERLREAFNTPLFPMVLVANEVMQEGLDLHHQCKRIVHHDLAWNPAQLEQRVGRIDRLGALIQRTRQKKADATLDVLYPLVERTIDVRLDRTVRAREKWMEFLLGAKPDLEEYNLGDDPVLELPQAFADALRVDLGPDSVTH